MSETEIQGVHQSDVIIRSAIVRSLERLYADPSQLDHVFHSLAEDAETNMVYGEKQIEMAKKWFLNSNIPVMMAFRVAEEAIPCITISLQESTEAEQTHGDVHYQPQEETAGDWPVLTDKFTPLAYSPTSGIMVLPPGLMGDQVIAPGMFVVTRDGRKYQIQENLGDDEISLAPNTVGDFVNAVIKGSRKRYVTTIESVLFKETYQIGIHVQNEPAYLLYLHAIVLYCLLKYKQDLLEARGFERSALASTDFRRNQEFDVEEVFSRFITITGFVRQSWPKAVKPMIDVVNFRDPNDPNFGLIFSATGDDTSDDEQSVNELGKAPDADDPWSVFPISPAIPATAATRAPDPTPPDEGMVLWLKGDTEMNSTAGSLTSWLDQAGQHQDINLVSSPAPQTGLDTIDGIPALTFPAGDNGTYGSRNTALKDRDGVAMPYTHARTVMAVFRPTRHESVGRIGGPVFATADQPNFECLFQVENWFIFNDAWFIFDNIWSFSGYQRLGPVTSIATWEDVPVLAEWRSSGYPEIAFAVYGGDDEQLQSTSGDPVTTQNGAEAASAGATFAVGNCWNNSGNLISANFHGSIAEIIVWDYDLRSNAEAYAAALSYFRFRYPSFGI